LTGRKAVFTCVGFAVIILATPALIAVGFAVLIDTAVCILVTSTELVAGVALLAREILLVAGELLIRDFFVTAMGFSSIWDSLRWDHRALR
jgi:hypothetical protein